MTPEQRAEIKAAILFYELRGWDWGPLVAFLCMKFMPAANMRK